MGITLIVLHYSGRVTGIGSYDYLLYNKQKEIWILGLISFKNYVTITTT